jgi:predicted polyphosphate/ATP-dependent NAD kinase
MTQNSSSPRPVGIVVNPVSGRDVRRLAARAGTSTPDDKRNQVQRIIVGAAAAGAEQVVLVSDPFRIADAAVEALGVDIEVEMLDLGTRCHPGDTPAAAEAMRQRGCGVLVVLGGDGTNRQIVKCWPDAPLIPISTGTNNVFPTMVEATMAGAAAGLVASGRVPLEAVSRRAKIVRAAIDGETDDLALIDAVHLVDDSTGNRLPYEPANIRRILVSRAEPCAVGISPIAGLLHPTTAEDDRGVEVTCGAVGAPLLVPISPGLYTELGVVSSRELPLGERVEVAGPGLLAFDGDRERDLAPGQGASLWVERSGPPVIDVPAALREAARRGSYREGRPWRDHRTSLSSTCC